MKESSCCPFNERAFSFYFYLFWEKSIYRFCPIVLQKKRPSKILKIKKLITQISVYKCLSLCASYIYTCTYPKKYAVLFGYSKYCSYFCEQ